MEKSLLDCQSNNEISVELNLTSVVFVFGIIKNCANLISLAIAKSNTKTVETLFNFVVFEFLVFF
jgi:hypothetical protein